VPLIPAHSLLGLMTGVDPNDAVTLTSAENFYTDYTQFLDSHALVGARIGVPKDVYWDLLTDGDRAVVEQPIHTMEGLGATIVFEEISTARDEYATYLNENSSIYPVLDYEFKRDLNNYLASFGAAAPVKSLTDLIAFKQADPETRISYGPAYFETSESLDLVTYFSTYLEERATDLRQAKDGLDQYIDQFHDWVCLFI
jgi:amidase